MMAPTELQGLGEIVWWSLPEQISTTRADWNTTYPNFIIPNEPSGDPLRRALFAIVAPKGSRRLIRPLQTRNHWGVVIETPTQDDDLEYSTEFTVKAEGGTLAFIKYSSDPKWAVDLEYNYRIEVNRVTTGIVADLILSTVRGTCLAVQARKTGGVYFIPTDYKEKLDAVEELVTSLGGKLYRFPVNNDGKQRGNLLQMIVEDLKSAQESVKMNLDARHKTDGLNEGRLALNRISYYRQALGVLTEEAGEIEKTISQMLVDAVTKKEKGDK